MTSWPPLYAILARRMGGRSPQGLLRPCPGWRDGDWHRRVRERVWGKLVHPQDGSAIEAPHPFVTTAEAWDTAQAAALAREPRWRQGGRRLDLPILVRDVVPPAQLSSEKARELLDAVVAEGLLDPEAAESSNDGEAPVDDSEARQAEARRKQRARLAVAGYYSLRAEELTGLLARMDQGWDPLACWCPRRAGI